MRSNTYTLIFTSITTIVLGFLLSFVSESLKEDQRINVEIDITIIHIHEKIDCCKLEYLELKYPIGKKDDLNAFINPPKFK